MMNETVITRAITEPSIFVIEAERAFAADGGSLPSAGFRPEGFAYSVPAQLPRDPAATLISAEEARKERDRMTVEHLPIVRFVARRIHGRLPKHVDIDDLISAGVIGLIDAFNKFDPEKNIQFRSYAEFRVRGAILDSMRALDWAPRDLRGKGRAVDEAIRSLTLLNSCVPSDVDVSNELKLDLGKYQHLKAELKGLEVDTLYVKRSQDSVDEEMAYIPTGPEEDPLFNCLQSEMKQRLIDAIDQLPPRERLVMTQYYFEEKTMREIGNSLGVVESRVSQQRASAIKRLRGMLPDMTSHPEEFKQPPVRTTQERRGLRPQRAKMAGDHRRSRRG
jgi:RNA polymerase sigma factor for flagellar operon FliA